VNKRKVDHNNTKNQRDDLDDSSQDVIGDVVLHNLDFPQ
jgi:hypothetical protein